MQASQPGLTDGDSVIVVTFDDETTARFVLNGRKGGFAPDGFGGPPWAHPAP